ncbi:YkvA family protein [Bradyrhizobium sp. SYSU BS000235]|uniref:YkvA family protein n=1 Tax=Bradyrhizobium sp. SYSU BS000235 TaxID=3411332 RepID=UPI003C7911C8
MLANLKAWAKALKRDVHAIYFAARDPRVPWYAKALALAVAGYALSPIDLIPDFIPVLGYLDDLILVPIGIWLVVALIPSDVMVHCRALAAEAERRPVSKAGAIAIISIWLVGAAAMIWVFLALGVETKHTDARPA